MYRSTSPTFWLPLVEADGPLYGVSYRVVEAGRTTRKVYPTSVVVAALLRLLLSRLVR